MKNQYFGDINDYRKYGLLRAISSASEARILVAWMLTPDDGRTDGKFTSYLGNHAQWAAHDPALFHWLHKNITPANIRAIEHFERADLLPKTEFFSKIVPDRKLERSTWFKELKIAAARSDLVFLDPDNGIEVRSKPCGVKGSSKYVMLDEIRALWKDGKSLLIYQHFIRENRFKFASRMVALLESITPGSSVKAYRTANVIFVAAIQPAHGFHEALNLSLLKNWRGQVDHFIEVEVSS